MEEKHYRKIIMKVEEAKEEYMVRMSLTYFNLKFLYRKHNKNVKK